MTDLVGLVVVLWVVLEDLGLLLVVKVANKVIESKLLPPRFTVNEPLLKTSVSFQDVDKVVSNTTMNIHLLRKWDLELSRSEES